MPEAEIANNFTRKAIIKRFRIDKGSGSVQSPREIEKGEKI